MTRKNYIFLLLSLGLSIFFVRAQQIGNYVSDGSFEILVSNSVTSGFNAAKYWQPIDSADYSCNNMFLGSLIPPLSNLPYLQGFQYPRTGKNCALGSFYHPTYYLWMYPRNRLKQKLIANKAYCVKFYVVNANNSSQAHDSYSAYFSDSSLDTISCYSQPLTFLSPQVQNPINNFISDTLNWTAVSGTFVATGNEKYLVLGNFKSAAVTNTILVNSSGFPGNDSFIDDVSVIEVNLSAYAGKDTTILSGDSTFIGRQPDFAIDPGCIWYKLPNMTTSIDTISGLWVKPMVTTTYVVKQQLECSALKWDTVIVYVSGVGYKELQVISDKINLYPNPTSYNLNISFTQGVSQVSITNSLGQIIRQQDLDPKINQITLQTSDLSSGLYQIHFKTSFGTVTKKFVKTN
ncbi:MAG: T9SS type A sorting domain-containing protein [Sphingobacteriaceae bacterium]